MENIMCQCCLTSFIYDKGKAEHCFEQKPIYSQIIKETFNITITSDINQICMQCSKKLREASEFRRLIITSQDELKEMFHISQTSELLNIIKNDGITKMDNDLWEIDKDSDVSNTDSMDPIPQIKTSNHRTQKLGIKRSREKSEELKENLVNNKDNISTFTIEDRTKRQKAIREDSMKLLKYSNMCLFKSLKTKFQCYTCKDSFINMSDLRAHTKIHSNSNDRRLKINLKGYSSKNCDISSLTCKLCQQLCTDLKILKQHLENKHKIQFHSNEHMFVPYKLENGFQCVICGENFNNFVRLSTHMNNHSTNNVCEICGLFFINRLSLRTHLYSHQEKKCTICMAKFEKNYAKTKHMRTVHNIGSIKRYCSLCGKDFKHSYMLMEHRIKEHGVKRQISNCMECNKTFLSPQNLKIHIRSVHIKERNFQCNICGMRFFTKTDEKRHEMKHNDAKLFSCSYCEGKFKSKDSWRRHLKRIHDKLIVD